MTTNSDSQPSAIMGWVSLGLGTASIFLCCIPQIGIIFSLLLEVIGLILGIVGLNRAAGDPGARQLNIFGIVLNACLLVLALVLVLLVVVAGVAFLGFLFQQQNTAPQQ